MHTVFIRKSLLFSALSLFAAPVAWAESYAAFLDGVRDELQTKGISVSIFNEAMGANPTLNPEVTRRLNNQPESTYTFTSYFNRLASDYRVKNGVENARLHAEDLAKQAERTQVPEEVILALWGVETAYGKLPGDFDIIPSLADLAYKSHRRDFFRSELIKAVQIVDEGHIPLKGLKGSWAGAMGQCQFMPSSFFRFAADGNGDGRKDIWQTEADVFASAGNYLNKSGWQPNAKWGERVVLGKKLPRGLGLSERGLSEPKPLSMWKEMGVYAVHGGFKGVEEAQLARLFIPDGPSQKAYLVYNNFDVILKWNRSSYFAFSVLSLADKIAAARKG